MSCTITWTLSYFSFFLSITQKFLFGKSVFILFMDTYNNSNKMTTCLFKTNKKYNRKSCNYIISTWTWPTNSFKKWTPSFNEQVSQVSSIWLTLKIYVKLKKGERWNYVARKMLMYACALNNNEHRWEKTRWTNMYLLKVCLRSIVRLFAILAKVVKFVALNGERKKIWWSW